MLDVKTDKLVTGCINTISWGVSIVDNVELRDSQSAICESQSEDRFASCTVISLGQPLLSLTPCSAIFPPVLVSSSNGVTSA